MKIALCSSQMPTEAMESLRLHCDKVVGIPSCDALYPAIRTHPDIQVCPVDKNTLVVHPDFDLATAKELRDCGIQVIWGESKLLASYPGNVPYNVAIVGDRYFHLLQGTDPVCSLELKKEGNA